jgi:hypothetical protein
MNNRQKMNYTNSRIKNYLYSEGYHSLYLFPHLRYLKDYIFEGQGFDAMGWKTNEKMVFYFQFKTNKKPSKAVLKEYKIIGKKFHAKCLWINYVKGKIEVYGE